MNSKQINNLVILSQRGQKEAFSQLYQLFAPEIFRFVYFRVRSKEDAEDLTQKIFLKAYKGLRKNQGKFRNFRAWLYQVSRNSIIDYYRTLKIHLSWQEREIEVKDDWEKKAEIEEILELLDKLKDKEKEVLVLNFIQGFKLKEIAKIIKKSPVAVRLIKYRAIKKLRKFINI